MNKHARFSSHGLQIALMVLACCSAGSAMAAQATATSTSTVVTPIAISKTVDLAFGSFAATTSAGSVTVSPDGTRSLTGVLAAGGATPQAAQFSVTGEAGLTYSIALTGTATLTSGANSMAFVSVSDTTASNITSGNVANGTLNAGGAQTIFVGGTLTVGASQAAGTYTGNVVATVNYN